MKIVVFGATGNVGQRVIAESLRRGHAVVTVVRDPAAVTVAVVDELETPRHIGTRFDVSY